MLGISTGLMYQGFTFEDLPLILEIDDCIAWYDFTDASSMYQTDSSSGTNVSSNGDTIGRIYNKVWTSLQTPNALSPYLRGSGSSATNHHREYKTGGQNGHSYVRLEKFAMFTSLGVGVGGDYSSTWPLSESVISLDNFTIFLIADHSGIFDGRAFSIFGDKEDANDSSRKEFHIYSDHYGSSNGQYRIDCYDGSTLTTIDSLDFSSGQTSNGFHIITGVLSGSGDSKLYRDGDSSDGTTTANSGSGSIDLTYDHSTPDNYQRENRILIGRNMNLGAGSDSSTVSPTWAWGSNSKIYEIICYNRELTSDEISIVETHLIEKYNIT